MLFSFLLIHTHSLSPALVNTMIQDSLNKENKWWPEQNEVNHTEEALLNPLKLA